MSKVIVFDPFDRSYDQLVSYFGEPSWPPMWESADDELFLKDVDEAQFVLLTGGTDVNPYLYKQKPNVHTQFPDNKRDMYETRLLNYCVMAGIPVVGICRGAQMLHVFNGGELIQHIKGHTATTHAIELPDKSHIQVTGDHHQCLVSSGDLVVGDLVLAKSIGDNVPEVVAYDHTDMLGFQYHPEWMNADTEGRKFFIKLVEELVDGQLDSYIADDLLGRPVLSGANGESGTGC